MMSHDLAQRIQKAAEPSAARWTHVAEVFVDDENGHTVCTPMGKTPEQRVSRARLIACAPEMAEMLLEAYQNGFCGEFSRDDCAALLKKAGVL